MALQDVCADLCDSSTSSGCSALCKDLLLMTLCIHNLYSS